MKDEETKDGAKLEGAMDSSGESVYSSAKEFDEDYETTSHEPRPSAGSPGQLRRADRSGEPLFRPRLDPVSDKNWIIILNDQNKDICDKDMWNVKCVSSTMSSRQPYPKINFYSFEKNRNAWCSMMFQDLLLWIFEAFERSWNNSNCICVENATSMQN